MRVGELAELGAVSTKTVRYYESIGLLKEPARTPAGYRDYGVDAVERLSFIRDAQASGLSLAEISSVLELKEAGQTSCAHTRALLQRHLDSIDEQINRLHLARQQMADLASRAAALDPADCTDPNRCQVIAMVTSSDEGHPDP